MMVYKALKYPKNQLMLDSNSTDFSAWVAT